MTLPPAVESTAVDPFGLWQPPPERSEDALSFSAPGESVPESAAEGPAARWILDLTSAPDGRLVDEQALDRLAGQVQAIQAGLDAAAPRVEAFLSARSRSGAETAVSYALGEPTVPQTLPPPEAGLALALNTLEGISAESGAPGGVNYGLPEIANINWEELYQRLTTLFDSVNRQILHFAWVDTTLDGRLIARTTVNWGGDFVASWQTGLTPQQTAAHCRSLALALEARLANLRAILTVSQIAAQIALAVATPLGPLQAMSLAWQFVNTVLIT